MEGSDPANSTVTALLEKVASGDSHAADQAFAHVYEHLRRLAGRCLANERSNHTLQPTALVHEAYLRLVRQDGLSFSSRGAFLSLAAQAMRRILVDRARRRRAEKRGGNGNPRPLGEADLVYQDSEEFVSAVDEYLGQLAALDPRQAKIVELRFFAGLTVEETGRVLNISSRTVNREWLVAKGWLHRAMSAET